MDAKSYISTGILELYVAGQLNETESLEVIRMAEVHPEVRAELTAIEDAIAAFAEPYRMKPKRDLLGAALEEIDLELATEANTPPKEAEVRPLHQASKNRRNWLPWLVAASLALLISLIGNGWQFSQLQETKGELMALSQHQQVMADNLQQTRHQLDIFTDPNRTVIPMEGINDFPNFAARVYWSPQSEEVWLLADQMRPLSQDEQYQLWALLDIDGTATPVDAGIFDPQVGLQQLKPIAGKVVAFAVTIEPRGGSESPTLQQMCLYGELS